MFESIVNDYLESTPYKEWSIISILQYTASKSELSRDTIDILKTDSYSVLRSLCKRCNTQGHAKNKANKILSNYDKSFSSDDVKRFIDEVQLKNERKEFNIAVCRNVTSANTLQTLKEHRVARIEIEDIRNVDAKEVTISTALKRKSHPSQSESSNKKTTIDLSDQSEYDSGLYYEDLVERVQEEVDIFGAQRIELLESLETKSRLENYNIICLFDVEFPYTKQLFKKLPIDQMCMIKNKWSEAEEFISKKKIEECWNGCSLKKLVDNNHRIIKENGNEDTFYVDLNALITSFTKQQFDNYEHRKTYELFWCQDFYTRMALQLLRRHSALLDSSSSEYQYRDEIVNPLLASIFYDVEDALWIKTGEIENDLRKRQRNFTKQENERERLGDKHDGILYMNVRGVKVGVGFIEVVGNAFATITSDKNDDLEKLLKAMAISLWYQHAHRSDENTSKLQSFAVLVYGREFHFLSMHLIGDMYVVDEYDAFVIPDSGLNLLHIGDIVKIVKKFKIRMIKYYHKLIQKPHIVTRPPISGLPTASPSKSK